MHTWYKAVCDKHKEACDVLVTSTFHIVTNQYLEDNPKFKTSTGNLIVTWLDDHYGCDLRLVKRDDEIDKLWDNYKMIDKNGP